MKKPGWSDKPTCKGWWWCFLDSKCSWYNYGTMEKMDKKACVVPILEDDGYFYPDRKGEPYAVLGLSSHESFSFDPQYGDSIFGRWYGPIPPPEPEEDAT
jgi:hypothetical protein